MGYMESQVVAGKSYDTPYLFDTKHLRELVASNNIEELKQFMKENNLIIRNHKIVSKFDDEIVKQQAYWNLTQKIYKISINSTYGALLTSGSKWYDVDQGRSITLTGQNITRHMTSFAIQEMTGDYDYLNDGVKIGDTDSCYISISDAFKSKGKQYNMSIEELVDYADEIGEKVNASFPEFMHKKFGVDLEHGAIIKAGRENVFYSCLCVVKKHYAGLVVNADGHYIYSKVAIHISDSDMKKYIDLGEINGKHYIHSPKGVIYSKAENGWCPLGKLKITGLDELRSDVSPEVKVLLRKILCIILLGGGKNIVEDLVIEKYNEIKKKTHWELGMPKSCKNVSEWEEKIGIIDSNYESSTLDNLVINKGINLSDENGDKFGKVIVPAVASACINWNRLRLLNNDRTSPQLMNGHRLIFMKLKYPNQYNIKNIALPYDISVIPEWFKNLPFDDEAMIQSIFMKKIENITKPMNWTFDLHRDIWENQFEDVEYE